MLEATRNAFGTMFGLPEPPVHTANIVQWIVSESALPMTQVDNYVRSMKKSDLVKRASNGDYIARATLMKRIGDALGIPVFEKANTVEEIMDAARKNRERPTDEAAEIHGNPLIETVCYREGHKNSKGEPAPWVIVSHKTGKILSSHKSEKKAKEHLRQMEYYKNLKESADFPGNPLMEGHFDDPKMEKAIGTACRIAGVDDEGDLSDGNHTFNDLYHQRCMLFATLVNMFPEISWKTKRHDDGELCFGGKNFLVCIDTPAGPYSYHYPLEDWDRFNCQEIEKAKPFDGHTDKDVERLLSLVDLKSKGGKT